MTPVDLGRPAPADYQPPVGWWGTTWRLLLVGSLSAMVLVSTATIGPAMMTVQVLLGLVALGLVLVRRRAPFAVAMLTGFLGTFSWLAAGPAVLAAVSLATRRRWREIVPLAVLSLGSGMVYAWLNPPETVEPWWLTVSSNVIVVVAMIAWGMYVGSRRELLWTLRARAERAESEQELRVGRTRLAERSRIAREMHDVLAHRISQISMHAGALTFRADLDPAQVRASAGVIQDSAHRALEDLRTVLGVLRDPAGPGLDAPQPTYAELGGLVDQARAAGLRVRLEDRLAPAADTVPEAAGRTLYRIVQEGITNAGKHSPGSQLSIVLDGSPEAGIEVELRNPLGFGRTPVASTGAGLGLVGLVERAELRGGRLEHGRVDGAFVVRGWIPWAA